MKFFYCLLMVFLAHVHGQTTYDGEVDPWEVRCEVCKVAVREMESEISKVDPKKKVEVGGFRIDSTGNTVSRTVQLSKSETYMTELMETVCSNMEDYAKVKHKKTGRVGVIKMLVNGQMNPDVAVYDFVQDGDLNKSLEHYCLEILENNEEIILQAFMSETLENDLDIRICSERAKLCQDAPVQEEYKLEDEL